MYNIHESETRLNQYAGLLRNQEVSFKVLHWGMETHLTYNPVHRHSFYEICYVMGGEGTYLDDGRLYSLQKGTLFCSKPMITHQIKSDEGLYLLWICFELDQENSTTEYIDYFLKLVQQGSTIVYNCESSPTVSLWKSLLIPENKQWTIPSDVLPSIAHALVLSFINVFLGRKDVDRPNIMKSNPIVSRAKQFIIDNLEKQITLEMLASYLNVSSRHLSRLFSEDDHESFVSFLRKERVKSAQNLLKTTNLPLKVIAEKTGFGSIHYFTRVFSMETGSPPGLFRNNHCREK
ncbi:AraC family transcriptional regulator [Neobacillus kokaensis]|uniref:HTH-type transcriptional regulator YfiF n=1 Tax=Neobacillus kokaensis TaxID=2759023 RepID=A0ABQ3N4H4_9BACI|nr:AraC family transcriptional regulator [Neobacillus kokaensis]GHH99833.1 putative HTH-type transcriptional regulator YfiF [Neobacillus kokaensis]